MMTSVSLRKKAKLASPLSSEMLRRDYSAEREGIFDQFSRETDKELYYYAVYSSSDSEGNITVLDVKREKFDGDTAQTDGEADEQEEGGDQEPTSHSKKRYGFRTRRSRKHKDDDEFETSLGDSSGESGEEDFKFPVSSDDETYDIAVDNWTFVRGAKKKEGNRKKNESPKKSQITSPKKSTPLKIRFKSAFRKKESKLQKLAENIRKAKIATKSKRLLVLASQKNRKIPQNSENQNSAKMTTASFQKAQPSKDSHTVQRLSKKSPSRIRCGYNSTAPKIQEIRHIRRRQLRQTPSRLSQSGISIYEEASSSSSDDDFDGEAPKTQGMRTRKISRIENESNFKENTESCNASTARKSESSTPPSGEKQENSARSDEPAPSTGSVDSGPSNNEILKKDTAEVASLKATRVSPRRFAKFQRAKGAESQTIKTTSSVTPSVASRTPSSDTATTTTSTLNGNGLKLVIRRQSIDISSHAVTSEIAHEPQTEQKPREYSPGFLGARKKQILRTVQLKSLQAADNLTENESLGTGGDIPEDDGGTNEKESDVKRPANCDETSDLQKESEDKNKVPDTTAGIEGSPQSESKDSPGSTGNKASPEEEAGKKRKTKKRRKKDRGRNGSTAGTEDAFDAQHTAMRLAMELPRHNWLVNSLIKDNKLKAEDDKPRNNLPEGEEGNAQTPGNTVAAKEQQIGSSQQAAAEGTESHTASRPTEGNTPTQSEETQPTEGRKHPNPVKGSFMVGIVKPFQHLKMSPSNMEAAEMSPPALCIADEEEDAQTGNENRDKSKVQNSDSTDKNAAPEVQNLKEIAEKDTSSTKIPSTVSYGPKTAIVSTCDLIAASKRRIPGSVCTSITVNTAEISQCTMEKNFKSGVNPKSKLIPPPESEKSKTDENNRPSEVKGQSKINENASSTNRDGESMTNETEPEIKISNCFSLALDLTTKVPENFPATKSSDSDQPLDLTTGPKTGQTSPKVLDLSVKKGLSSPVPEKAVSSAPKPCTVPQDKPFVPRDVAVPSIPCPQPQPSSVVQKKPAATKSNSNVIVIDDDASDGRKMNSAAVQSTPRATLGVAALKTPPPQKPAPMANASGFYGNQPPQMKRAASCDATPFQSPSGLAPAKRSRLSLDERNSTRVQEGQMSLPQPVRNFSQQTLVMGSTISGTRTMLVEQMFAKASNQKPKNHQNLADSNKRLSDLLMISKNTASIPQTVPQAIPTAMGIIPSTYPSLPIRKPQPSTPKSVNGSNYIPTPRMSVPDLNNNNVIKSDIIANSGRAGLGDLKTAPSKGGRHRSLDSTCNAAQMVAQAYPGNVRQLEPYIKQQQRVVDQKIQELEAIKRQLASASATVNGKTPPPPYPQVPAPLGKIFASSLQQRSTTPSMPHQNVSPPRQYRPVTMPRTTVIRPTLAHHPTIGNAINSMPLPRGQIVRSRYAPPALPRASRARPPVAVGHSSLPQARIPAPPTWRVLSPRVERGIEPSKLSFQRAMSNGGQISSMGISAISGNQTGTFPRAPPTPSQLATNQIQRPASYRQPPHQSSLPRPPIPMPRMVPVTTAPVYRNGGLTIKGTFKTRLNEPIVIEDDIIRSSGATQDSRKRPGSTQFIADSLQVRRAHSYHPPLSNNRAVQSQIIHTTGSNQWTTPTASGNYSAPQAPTVPDGPGEFCVKCRRKAYFLCSGCRKIWYCSKDCQVKDWSSHSAKCSV